MFPPLGQALGVSVKATAHLIHGYLGVGKTTYARQLAAELGAVCLSMDEWYLRPYTDGNPASHQDYELLARLWRTLDEHWPRLVSSGVDVVLDFGYWRRQDRDRARQLAAGAESAVTLHWVVADDVVARDRCLRRNDDPQASFVIDASAYESLRERYQEPTVDEAPVVVRSD